MKRYLIPLGSFICVIACMSCAFAATYDAASCNSGDVVAAIGKAMPGDTVTIPSGNCTWDTNLTLSKNITLRGAGKSQTVITYTGSSWFMNITAAGSFRVSGFRLIGNRSNSGIILKAASGSKVWNWRIDNMQFDDQYVVLETAENRWYKGVFDHNAVNNSAYSTIRLFGDEANEWARQTPLGSDDGIYFETNTFTYDKCGTYDPPEHSMTSNAGARWIFRYNTVKACSSTTPNQRLDAALDHHGYCTPGYKRGTYGVEIYNNTIDLGTPTYARGFYLRGGRGVVFNNSLAGATTPYELMCELYQGGCGLGTCAGYPCQDQINKYYIWGNTGKTTIKNATPEVIQLGRDYFTTAMPGYTPYTYPHPLTSGSAPTTPPPAPPPPTVLIPTPPMNLGIQ